jgi:adhesin/invasin
MNSWQKRPANRWAAAAVVIGSVSAVLASPLAIGTAAAAPVSSITIGTAPDPVPSTSPATATATVTATYSPAANPAPTDIMYAVTAGGDSTGVTGVPCTANTSGAITCTVSNTSHAPASDTVKVFEDTGSTPGSLDGTDVLATPTGGVTVTFSGPPSALTFTTAPTTGTAGTCVDYTAHASLSGSGALAGDQPLNLTVTETSATNPPTGITLFPTGCGNGGSTTATNSITGSGPYNNTFTHTVTTLPNGDVTFGLQTDTAGTGTVKLSVPSNPAVSTSTVAVTWNTGGANSVTSLSPNPPSTNQLTGTTASFTVTATNNGSPVQGVTVMKETTGGPDTVAPTSCGTTNSSGQVTCTVHNGGTAGADALTFWVDNTSASCSHTTGPDSCEPKTTATATFTAAPAVSAANSSLTCVQQLSGADKGKAKTDCTLPTSQTSVTFTATVEDASGNPIANAPVTFTTTAAKLGGTTLSGSNLPASATTNTGANGTATYTVTDATPANGDNVTVSAAVGATSIGTATAHWVAPAASSLSVQPVLQTVTEGGTVTVKATVIDQFGNPVSGTHNITYFVTGRNNAKAGTAAADGTITYTDAGTVAGQKTDTIQVTDVTDGFNGTANVVYVTGSTSASTVTVDTSGNGTSDANCAASGHTAATGVALQHQTEVCAVVKNATGEALAGKTVTFTVSNGQVDAHGGLTATSGTTFQATTDAAGVAFADVTSTKSGAQTVTATADGQSGTGTVTYVSPAATAAYSIALAPAAPTVNPGAQQKFTATVTDKFGNAVSGVSVTFTQSGPGSLGGASSQSVTTGADGTAAVTLTTASSDTGSGSITATIATAGTQCASAPTGTPPSKCTATSTYSVAPTGSLALTLAAEHNAKAGTHETVTATVTNADHTPAANRIVRFFVSGANTAQSSATTDATGHAHIAYLATHHGTDTIQAYVDVNNDQIRTANEPKQSVTAHILGREHPHLRLSSNNGKVTAHVNTRPNANHALVRYYVKRHGSWHKLGSSHTNGRGNDHHSFKFRVGSHHRFRVKVSATAITTAGTSAAKGITVKR